MADLAYPIGVKKILDHLFDSTLTLENTTNALFAVLVQGSYVALETHLDMTSITGGSHEWDGTADFGMGTATPLVIPVANITTAIDGNNKVQLILPNLDFGAVTVVGEDVAGCVVYVVNTTDAADTDRFPLAFLNFTSPVTPVVGQDLTIVTNTNGVVLFNPQA